MKVLATLLVVLVLGIVLLPLIGVGLALSIPLLGLFLWFLPILIILASDRTSGGEKLAWILAIVFLSWFAWIFYFLLAPISGRSARSCRYTERRFRRSRYDRYYDDYEYRY